MLSCQSCGRDMPAHLNRLSRIELTGPDTPMITMKVAAKGDDQDAGLKLTGKGGCRRCLTADKILGYFLPQLAASSGQPWTHATVCWKDGHKMVPVAREDLDIPKPVEPREVAVIGRIKVIAVDEPGEGGANHDYLVLFDMGTDPEGKPIPPKIVGGAQFQRGPVGAEGSRDGITIEAMLAMAKDRLEGFQRGLCPCEENERALNHIEMALAQLNARTQARQLRGVEGTVAP